MKWPSANPTDRKSVFYTEEHIAGAAAAKVCRLLFHFIGIVGLRDSNCPSSSKSESKTVFETVFLLASAPGNFSRRDHYAKQAAAAANNRIFRPEKFTRV
jgi:hypothetical protein